MRRVLLTLALAFPLAAAAAQGDFAVGYREAKALYSADADGAIAGMTRSFEQAIAAQNSDYGCSAGLTACHWLYGRGRLIEAGALARRTIEALAPLPPDGEFNDAVRRVQLFGFIERGLLAEGRIGAAWQANRAAAETLRGKKVTADADGPSITVGEVIEMNSERRSMGWRLIERESELLDLSGQTLRARTLLDEAAAYFGDDWAKKLPRLEHFYAFKLLEARAMLIDFIGDEQTALIEQEKLVATKHSNPQLRAGCLKTRMNLLRNRSQWEGPSEDILQEARTVAAEAQADGKVEGIDRLLAKMELDFQTSQEALDALKADVKTTEDLGHWFESVYARRDSLLARSKNGEAGLESEFTDLLAKARAQGNKRTEPGLYQEYGEYLIASKRPAEAVPLLLESLRLTRSFGLDLHLPALLGTLFDAQFDAGDLTGAKATLRELEDFIRTHPDIPAQRRVRAQLSRALALSRLGDAKGVKEALALARAAADGLPEYQKSWLTPEVEARLTTTKAPEIASVAAAAETAPLFTVQPLELVSIALPGSAAHSRFTVFNSLATNLNGRFEIEGPGATTDETGKGVVFTAGKPNVTLLLPRALPAGRDTGLKVSFGAETGTTSAVAKVAWRNAGQEPGPASTWTASWDPGAEGSTVLDGSSLAANPFRYVSLFHEVNVPLASTNGIPFRLRASSPLRVEYYDARSQELLAIDANGNGSFTDPGDYHGVSWEGDVTAAIVPTPQNGSPVPLEIHLFASDGQPLAPVKKAISLTAEVWRDGAWAKAAEDLVR